MTDFDQAVSEAVESRVQDTIASTAQGVYSMMVAFTDDFSNYEVSKARMGIYGLMQNIHLSRWIWPDMGS